MPKKSKVNKLARMSDEERARYLQHRADVEEEARRRKRELVARFIKNKLDKEETHARLNTAKINQEWRYILRRIKCKQMSLDIQGMMSSFNFLVERKNRLLGALMQAIEDSDDQHRRVFQAHTETLSYFLKIGSQRLDKLQADYEVQKDKFLENWETEESDITISQGKADFKLILVSYIQDQEFQSYKKEKEIERATVKNVARLEHEEEMSNLCKPKQSVIETYCDKLREVYNMYFEKHNPIMGHFNALKEKDDFYQNDIAKNNLRIQQATETLLILQNDWLKSTNMMNCKLKRINDRKEELAKKYWLMKKESKAARSKEDDLLSTLVDSSQDAIQRLENYQEKLHKIKQLANICRKYEQEEDNLLLEDVEIGPSSDFEAMDTILIILRNYPRSDVISTKTLWASMLFILLHAQYDYLKHVIQEECREYRKFDKFLLKSNRIKVQTMCLKSERAKLAKENIQLKQYIKRYLTELALKGEKERPMSMKIQSEMQKIEINGKMNRPVTCIEGALSNAVMHEKRMKLQQKKIKEFGAIRAFPRVHCW